MEQGFLDIEHVVIASLSWRTEGSKLEINLHFT